MAVRLRVNGSSTLTLSQHKGGANEEQIRRQDMDQSKNCDSFNKGELIEGDSDHNETLAYFAETSPATKEYRNFWETPKKVFQIATRELSVLLILIETLILLGGYLMILGVHHSIRYGLGKLRRKGSTDDNVTYNLQHMRNYYEVRPVPRRLPRGRMAGG